MAKRIGRAHIDCAYMLSLLDIVDVINHLDTKGKIGLTLKSGTKDIKYKGPTFIGICPFHSEKSPSFVVWYSGQRFRCQACGKEGSLLKYYIEYTGSKVPVSDLAKFAVSKGLVKWSQIRIKK